MNRRDFIKTALAGLAALVLPKWKAEEAPPSTVTYADVRAMFDRNHKLETHSTVGPMFATDDLIADWEAMGWKPEG